MKCPAYGKTEIYIPCSAGPRYTWFQHYKGRPQNYLPANLCLSLTLCLKTFFIALNCSFIDVLFAAIAYWVYCNVVRFSYCNKPFDAKLVLCLSADLH